MKEKIINKVIFMILSVVQISIITLVIALEYLSHKRMGVARDMIYRNQVFEAKMFTPFLMNIYISFFVALAIVGILLLIYSVVKIRKQKIIKHAIFTVSLNLIGVIFILLQNSTKLNAYYFFIIAFLIIIIIQNAILFIKVIRQLKLMLSDSTKK